MATNIRNFDTIWSTIGDYYNRPNVDEFLPGPSFLNYRKKEDLIKDTYCKNTIYKAICDRAGLKNIQKVINDFKYWDKLTTLERTTFFAPMNIDICALSDIDEIDFLHMHTLDFTLYPSNVSKSIRVQTAKNGYMFDMEKDNSGKIYVSNDGKTIPVLEGINCCNGILYIIPEPIVITI